MSNKKNGNECISRTATSVPASTVQLYPLNQHTMSTAEAMGIVTIYRPLATTGIYTHPSISPHEFEYAGYEVGSGEPIVCNVCGEESNHANHATGKCYECNAACTDKDLVGYGSTEQDGLGNFPKYWCSKCIDRHFEMDRLVNEKLSEVCNYIGEQWPLLDIANSIRLHFNVRSGNELP